MSNIFSEMGFSDPTFETLRNSISGHAIKGDPSSYYGLMMISSVFSRITGQSFNRSNQNTEFDYRKEINDLRKEFSGKQKEFEVAFTRKFHNAALHHELDLLKIQSENMQNLEAFNAFCVTWNKIFELNINTIIGQIKNSTLDDLNKPRLGIAHTPFVDSFFVKKESTSYGQAYNLFCEAFCRKYGALNDINLDWITMWKSDRNCISPKSDAFILHFIMQGLPSIILFPIQKNNKFIIQMATWSLGTMKNNFYFNTMCEIPYTDEIDLDFTLDAIAIIAAFAADCYSSFYCNREATSLNFLQQKGYSNIKLNELLEKQVAKYKDSLDLFQMMGLNTNK